MELGEFVKKYSQIDMKIIDENYGYNQSKFYGRMFKNNKIQEFAMEIYHLGNMKYIIKE